MYYREKDFLETMVSLPTGKIVNDKILVSLSPAAAENLVQAKVASIFNLSAHNRLNIALNRLNIALNRLNIHH